MSIPPRLSVKLNDVLGAEAAHILVNWMDEVRGDLAELRHETHAVRAELGSLRSEVSNLRADVTALQVSSNAKFDKLVESIHAVDQRLAQSRGQFIAWSAAFWLTAVSAVVGLMQFLQR